MYVNTWTTTAIATDACQFNGELSTSGAKTEQNWSHHGVKWGKQ